MPISSLQELRAQFIELSGRKDLDEAPSSPLNTVYTKKADFYINGACKWLDDNVDIDRKIAHYSYDMSAGSYRLLVPDAKVIKKIYAQYDSEHVLELAEKEYSWIRDLYKESLSQVSNAKPAYWCKGVADLAPNQLALQTTDYTGSFTYEFGDTLFADESTPGSVGRYRTMSILILPPVDVTHTITVVGEFYSKFLSADADTNLWVSRYPELLLKAALRELEGFYRNTEGRKDWEDFLLSDKTGIEFIKADQESHNINQMEG